MLIAQTSASSDWYWVDGRITPGQSVASGRVPLPGLEGGTIRAQKPFFLRAGIPVADLYDGTMNVDIAPLKWRPSRAAYRIENLRWHPAFAAETFSLFHCAIALAGDVTEAFIYHPHPGPEPKALHGPAIMEIWSKYLPAVEYGRAVSIGVRREEVSISNQ